MPFDRFLLPDPVSYFESQGLTLNGPRSAKWKTTACNFHGGSDSMRVNVATGAWVCMSCGQKGGDVLAYEMQITGVEFVEAAKALGAWIDDGRSPAPAKPTPLSPRSALQALGFEAELVAIAAGNMAHGVQLTATDRARLLIAGNRIITINEAYK
jgi:hypothetical protein